MTGQSKFSGIFEARKGISDDDAEQEAEAPATPPIIASPAPANSTAESPQVHRRRASGPSRGGIAVPGDQTAPTKARGDTDDAEIQATGDKKAVGKVRGKRGMSGPDGAYTQVTAYITRDTHKDVMKRLTVARYDDPNNPDFSELVEKLLQEWLDKPNS